MLVLQRSLFLGDFSSPDCGCLWVFCLALFYLILVVVEVFHFLFSSFVRRAMYAFYEQRAPVYTFPCHLEVGQEAEQLWLLFSNLSVCFFTLTINPIGINYFSGTMHIYDCP